MARFYTDEKILISSLEDMTRRPNYVESVAPRKSLFRYVLAAYSFPRKIACCSVSDCYQNNKKGYLVRTAEGGDCSICESCARRFIDPLALKPQKPQRSRTAAARGSSGSGGRAPAVASSCLMAADTFATESERIKERVKALKMADRGANWLFRSLTNFRKGCPAEMLVALEDLRERGDEGEVFATLIETDASDRRLQDVEQLTGLEVFSGDIRQLLIEHILKPLNSLESKAGSGTDGVRVPLDWADGVEASFNKAEALIGAGQAFFSEENIARLKSIPLPDKAGKWLQALSWDSNSGDFKKG